MVGNPIAKAESLMDRGTSSTRVHAMFRCTQFLCMLLLSVTVWAAEPAAADPGQFAEAGMALLREADQDPAKLVEAAIAFQAALAGYEAAGDSENVCAMQANLFWCKKKMNLATTASTLARAASTLALSVPLAAK